MSNIVERLRKWRDVDKFPNPIQVLNQFREERFEAADEIERLRAAVALSVYELHFVADEHDCEQCREAANNIMKTAKGGPDG